MRDAIATRRSRRLMLVAVGLLAAVAVLPLLVPPSAVAWDLLRLEDRLALEATEISSAKVCGASECREVSDPEAATALAVGPRPRGTDAPVRGLPWYTSTLTIPAEGGGEVDRVSVSVTVVPSAGLMRVGGRAGLGDPAQPEQKGLREAHSRAYDPPGEDASGCGRGRAAGRPRRQGRRGPERGHPGAGERRLERLDRRAGRRRASGAHCGVAAQRSATAARRRRQRRPRHRGRDGPVRSRRPAGARSNSGFGAALAFACLRNSAISLRECSFRERSRPLTPRGVAASR